MTDSLNLLNSFSQFITFCYFLVLFLLACVDKSKLWSFFVLFLKNLLFFEIYFFHINIFIYNVYTEKKPFCFILSLSSIYFIYLFIYLYIYVCFYSMYLFVDLFINFPLHLHKLV